MNVNEFIDKHSRGDGKNASDETCTAIRMFNVVKSVRSVRIRAKVSITMVFFHSTILLLAMEYMLMVSFQCLPYFQRG